MGSKIILLNGPKACGKNVAVDRIKQECPVEIFDRRCKDHLFVATAVLFRMTLEEFFVHYECRETKELSKPEFRILTEAYNELTLITKKDTIPAKRDFTGMINISVREALIYVSEIICKPTFGSEYFGFARAEAIGSSGGIECAIDDSCGFDDEIGPTIQRLGMDSVMLIRIHGRGSFDGDSRNYISDGVVDRTLDVYNTGAEEDFLAEVSNLALEFYNN
jgi:hypothetical protein